MSNFHFFFSCHSVKKLFFNFDYFFFRYLYVNCRPWPANYVINNPFDPPIIASEIDIHVIDLTTFKEVGKMLRKHETYTPSDECFLIFLDVSDDYVAR